MKRRIPTLIIEQVADEGTLHLLSLLEHRRDRYLVIVDNIDEERVTAYVLDYAQQEGVDLEAFVHLARAWLQRSNGQYPLSFELSRLGLTTSMRRIYKTFDVAHVTRLIGRPFAYDLTTPVRVRRRRAARVPAGVEVRPRATVQALGG